MKSTFILVIIYCYLPIDAYCQQNIFKSFDQIVKERNAYFENQRMEKGDDLLNEEGSEFNEYTEWLKFWIPRIDKDQNFKDYMNSIYKNLNIESMKEIDQEPERSFGNADLWKEIGPTDKPSTGMTIIGGGERGVGPIQGIYFYKGDQNKLLASSYAGGLFFSSNKGVNWTNAGSDTWMGSGCTSADFSPNNPNIWYACSCPGGQNNASSIPQFGLSMGPFGGVYRTTNAGLSYDLIGDKNDFPVEGPLTTLVKIVIDPSNPSIGYVATSSGLYKSLNINSTNILAISWTLIHPGYIEDIEFKANNSSVVFITVKNNLGLWDIKYSTNGGVIFLTVPSQPIHTSTKNINIEITQADNDLIYVLERNNNYTAQLYTCSYSSFSWSIKGSLINSVNMGSGRALGISNYFPNTLYMAQGMSFYKSTNGGVSWSYISSSSPATAYHVDIEYIALPPSTCSTCSQDVWIATHGGVSFSGNECLSIVSRSNGLGVAEIFGFSNSSQNPGVIAIGLNHDGTLLSGGTYSNNWIPAWQTVFGGDGLPPHIDYSNDKYVWATSQGSTYNISQSSGQDGTFSSTACPLHNDWGNNIQQNQKYPNIVYVKGANNSGTSLWENLYRSSNRGIVGTPFEKISDIQNVNFIQNNAWIWGIYPSPSNPNYLYMKVVTVPGWTTYLLRTNNILASNPITVQASWQILPLIGIPGGGFTSLSVDVNNPEIVYLACNGNTGNPMVWKVDFSTSSPLIHDISDLSGTMPPSFVSNIVLEENSNGGIYVSTDYGNVYYTNNELLQSNPRTWKKMANGLPNIPISDMEIIEKAGKLRIASAGRGVWEHDLYCPSNLSLNITAFQSTNKYFEAINEIISTSIISPNAQVTYRAGDYIELNPGFVSNANQSNYFEAFIHPCIFK